MWTLISEGEIDGRINTDHVVDDQAFDNYSKTGFNARPEWLLVTIDARLSELPIHVGYLQTGGNATDRIEVNKHRRASFILKVPDGHILQIDASGAGGKHGVAAKLGGHCTYKIWIKNNEKPYTP